MFDRECPLCQANVPPSQSICDCGYSFEPNELEAAAQNLILTAREDEAYLDYLKVRFTQSLEVQDVAHTHLQADPDNERLQTEFEQAKTEAIEAQQELGALQARMIKTRAAVKSAKETVRKVRVKKDRQAAREKARLEAERKTKEAAARQAREAAERKAADERARAKRKAKKAAEEQVRQKTEHEARKQAKQKARAEAKRLAHKAREHAAREASARKIEQEAERQQSEERAAREAAAHRIEQEAIQREAAYKTKMDRKYREQQATEKAHHATQKAEQARLAASAAQAAEHAARSHLAQQQSDKQPVILKTAPQVFTQEQSSRAQAAMQLAKRVMTGGPRSHSLHVPNPAESGLGLTPADFVDEASPLVASNEPVNSLISHTSSINANSEDVCPHCTATLKPDQNKCGCGFERRPDDDNDGLALSLTDVDQAALSELSERNT
jgi:hypothetical protein